MDIVGKLIGTALSRLTYISIRGVIIMFFAAALHEQFGVWSPIGFLDSLPWSAAYGLVTYLFHGSKDDGEED